MNLRHFSYSFTAVLLAVFTISSTSCMQQPEEEESDSTTTNTTPPPKYLYVASGACYSGGGNTSFTNLTASNSFYRINASTGERDMIIADYSASPSSYGDSPVGIIIEDTEALVLIENASTVSLRRLEKVEKKSAGNRAIYSNNTTALSAPLRDVQKTSDGYLLVSRSTAIEKIKDGNNRLMNGANPWINLVPAVAASNCVTNSTLLSSSVILNNGNIVFAHAATGLNRIGILSSRGYTATASCLNANAVVAAPTAAAFPTAMAYDSVNHNLIVAYAGNSTSVDVNSIYVYAINETANTITAGVKIYDANSFGSTPGWNFLLYGISAITLDQDTKTLYVATAINTATTVVNYRIEKLNYDATKIGTNNNLVLTKSSSSVFYDYGSDTKCISDMTVGL